MASKVSVTSSCPCGVHVLVREREQPYRTKALPLPAVPASRKCTDELDYVRRVKVARSERATSVSCYAKAIKHAALPNIYGVLQVFSQVAAVASFTGTNLFSCTVVTCRKARPHSRSCCASEHYVLNCPSSHCCEDDISKSL